MFSAFGVDTYAANQVDLYAGVFQFLAILGSDDDAPLDRLAVFVERRFLASLLCPRLELDHVTGIFAVQADLNIADGLEEASHPARLRLQVPSELLTRGDAGLVALGGQTRDGPNGEEQALCWCARIGSQAEIVES
jgi:hypothetical protein